MSDALTALHGASAILGMLPEHPGYNGAVLLIDDEEAARCVAEIDAAAAELSALRAELETERMRVVACGVVACADTTESAKMARQMHADYQSAACTDVARRVDECIALRAERDALRAAADRVVAHMEGRQPVQGWLRDNDASRDALAALVAALKGE